MSKVGFVGNGTDKFTGQGEARALTLIADLLYVDTDAIVVSGHSPVGGIDIWAEDLANQLGMETDIKVPTVHQWNPKEGYGYKARNLDIAKESNTLHIIVASGYPEDYSGRVFSNCYHCGTEDHVKSGGCWTGKKALGFGNTAIWHIIENY